jgi:hypothetical protein
MYVGLLCVTLAAPAPPGLTPAVLRGPWEVTWGDRQFFARFREDGTFVADELWGYWAVERGRLVISEHWATEPPRVVRWEFVFDPKAMTGVCNGPPGGGPPVRIRLRRPIDL